MIYVYTDSGCVPVRDWDGYGTVSFSRQGNRNLVFRDHTLVAVLNKPANLFCGLSSLEAYCLFHLGVETAKLSNGVWVWHTYKSEREAFGQPQTYRITLSDAIVREAPALV